MKRDTVIGLLLACAATILLGHACTAMLQVDEPAGAQESPPTLEQILIWAAGTSAYGKCVRAHESDMSGGYRADNPTSTASGAYQMLNSTWRSLYADLHRGPAPWAHAKQAPTHVQDLVFAAAIAHGGQGHWKLTGCGRHL